MSVYDDARGLVVRGERLFPFACFDEKVDWAGVSGYLETIGWGEEDG